MSQRDFIKWGVVFRSFGFSITLIGLFMLTAIPFAIYFKENTINAILISAFISIGIGQILIYSNKRNKIEKIGQREAFLIVILTWFMLGLFGSLPYFFTHSIIGFTNMYFETISGFTTTGATILNDIEALPKSILYWRSLTQWLGGMGILVIVIAILPTLSFGITKLFIAEAPGLSGNKSHPNIRHTILRLWEIYTLFTLLLVVLLVLGGMNFFESICHAFTTLATGGFSPLNSSIENYSSYIQIVITIFMFMGGINFVIHYQLISGNYKQVIKNEELRYFIFIIGAVCIILGFILFQSGVYASFGEALRHGFFQGVSIITTTGFVTADYMNWAQITWFLLLSFFFVGGMIGSTSGGIKFTRHLVLIKNIRYEVKRFIHPKAIIPLRLNKVPISEDITKSFFVIFVSYIFVFCIGTIALSFFVDDVKEAISVSISCLGAVGIAFGKYGPSGSFAELHSVGKWICSILMVVGRLDIVPFLMLLNRTFWKK